MHCGISESEPILTNRDQIPSKEEKDHPFIKFMDVVVKDVVVGEELKDKKARKMIAKLLRRENEEWARMVVAAATQGKEEEEEEEEENSKRQQEQQESKIAKALEEKFQEATTPQHHSAKALARKEKFEQRKQDILDQMPDQVKERFGHVYFGKWGKSFLPCLVMNPFHIEPGNVRNTFYDMFEKCKSQDRLPNMTNVIYWYGSYEDPRTAYSFATTSTLVKYQVGMKKGYGTIKKALQNKIDQNKKLSNSEAFFVKGLDEMNEYLKKDPKDRHGRMMIDFVEAWEYEEDDEEEEEEEEEEKASETKESKKRKKKEEEDDDKEESKPKKRGRKKGSKNKPKEAKTQEEKEEEKDNDDKEEEEAEEEKMSKTTAKEETPSEPKDFQVANVEMDDIGDDEISSHEDKDDLLDAEPSSESDDDDEDYQEAIKVKIPKKKAKAKELPKKKSDKVKNKMEKPNKKVKKAISQGKLRKMEQERFTHCEKMFHDSIKKFKTAIEKQDKMALEELHKVLLKNIKEFSAPFIEVYEIPSLLKQSKKISPDCQYRQRLWQQLKERYISLKDKVPAGFVPKKLVIKERAEVKPPVEVSVPKAATEPIVDPTKADISIPRKDKANLSISNDVAPPTVLKRKESSQDSTQIAKQLEKKKKFSLGSYMMKPTPTTPPRQSTKSGKVISGQLSKRPDTPTWMFQASSKENPSDKNRSFGLEFLQQAAPFVPLKDKINHDGIAREIEAAIFKWAIGKEGVNKEWLGKYWEKLDDIVAAISGNSRGGTVATMIAEGKFRSAEEIIKLSYNDISSSFEGRPLLEFDQ